MRDPLAHVGTRNQPVTVKTRADQVLNNTGGYTFAVEPVAQLRRFLLLGTDGGTFHVGERELTLENSAVVVQFAQTRPLDLVREVVDVSVNGRAPKANPCLFALAAAFGLADLEGRQAAERALPQVVRTGTHRAIFARYVEQFRGWGKLLRRAVGNLFLEPTIDDLEYSCVKYRQREGWTNRDLLRLSHPVPAVDDVRRRVLFDWICGRDVDSVQLAELPRVAAFEELKRRDADGSLTDAVVTRLITEARLPWEVLPDSVMNRPTTWEALLDANQLPLGALIRQLPRLTRLGMLNQVGPDTMLTRVVGRLGDRESLRRARVHPLNLLVAQRTYGLGRNQPPLDAYGRAMHHVRPTSTWTPVRQVVDALDQAFYLAFENVEPTNARFMLAVDCSGSMSTARIAKLPLSPREVSAALSLVSASVEPHSTIMGFSSDMRPLAISPRQRLNDVITTMTRFPWQATRCAAPMEYALRHRLTYDAFVIYTDNEVNVGPHPYQALRRYRDALGVNAKLIVVAMTATNFTIADPSDVNTLDVCGFDTGTPALISDFTRVGI